MYKNHAKEYDHAVVKYGWKYRLSTDSKNSGNNPRDARQEKLPQFSPETFMEYLVRFIVADDQVSLKLSLLVSCSYMS
jgi:hypothetical protein